jgi:8-oxo-dGTP pyrophosphatase MutT (NUDIX family)
MAARNRVPTPLSARWLRARFAETPAARPPASGGDLTAAAVLVPIVERGDGLTLLLTQRTAHLNDHPGQISFPGGRAEAHDDSSVSTALREAQEEIGLDPARVDVIGTLPEYRTITRFSVTPVVAIVRPPFALTLDRFEVAEAFEAPLDFLLDERNHERHVVELAGARRHYYAMPWQGRFIWGATAGMIVGLHRFLAGDAEAGPRGDGAD